MKLSKTALKLLTARYRAVLLKCAMMNAVVFIGMGTANAADLTIAAGQTETVDSMTTYDNVTMTGGELKIVRNAADDEVEIDFYGASTISGGTVSLSTPKDAEHISLYFGNGLSVETPLLTFPAKGKLTFTEMPVLPWKTRQLTCAMPKTFRFYKLLRT